MITSDTTIQVSIVIPVYRGEGSLPSLMEEISHYVNLQTTQSGNIYRIYEVILVHDCGPDRSDLTIEQLVERYDFVRAIWLSRNYGQHPATLAGMAGCTGDWVVTMDEDHQQNPADIGPMLDLALKDSLQIVYAAPMNTPPHGVVRNALSAIAKKIALQFFGGLQIQGTFNSFRLIDGEIARILAAYCGDGVYLDMGLFWVATRIGYCPVELRHESRPSGYSIKMLSAHFWRMILTSGTKPLRLIAISGAASFILSIFLIFYAFYGKFIANVEVQGWTSLLAITAFFSGLIMMSLGIIAEYLALSMGIAMGKPLYMIASKPVRPPQQR
jgi:undecaprenyl-phosphate 4-deoxy-4-formamido-L-arabinose transferase